MRWTWGTLSTWKCIGNYWISSPRHCQCQNRERQRAHRCSREWWDASPSTTCRGTSIGTTDSSAVTIGARMMWRRCRCCGKISVCPIGMGQSLVSSDRTQSVATQRPASVGNALATAKRALWLVSPDQFPSFSRPFPSNRFVRCSLCICDSCYSFHFRFWPPVDHCDCHNRGWIFPTLQRIHLKIPSSGSNEPHENTYDNLMDCTFWDTLNLIRLNMAPATAFHRRICTHLPQAQINDRINQTPKPTADGWCTQLFGPPVPTVSEAAPLVWTLNCPSRWKPKKNHFESELIEIDEICFTCDEHPGAFIAVITLTSSVRRKTWPADYPLILMRLLSAYVVHPIVHPFSFFAPHTSQSLPKSVVSVPRSGGKREGKMD